MENKTIFEMIETKYKESLLNEKQEKTLKKEMEEEIETSTKKIKESYKEKFEVLEQNTKQLNNELSNYNYLLKKYSSFNTKMIGKLLEKIISEIECEPYSFQISNHETYHVESTVYGSEKFKCDTKCAMVVKNNFKDSTYYDRDLYDNVIKKLSNKGNALILYENELIPNDINFYSFSKKEIECLVNFKNFPYVKEFIEKNNKKINLKR